ncbi:hypothetical protein [Ancylobacter pratisalsi]|uniref:Uncharacterized protein n=1 Tax=Ancylobacter pratisalsi TaxID=1745854 RepID=A0A6P1YHA3_9HYPH|nr:hypothetical protein [Ancylobacter pratisalsi]QIB32667.1 hypothetical protein G3A50_02330 [Ancylobacter pratisalsi]
MTLAIELGWWIAPAAITAISYVVAFWSIPEPQPSSFLPDLGPAITGFINLSVATIISLVAWLVWSLLS